jgi:N-sulfoglucosamine sulfohydrolase
MAGLTWNAMLAAAETNPAIKARVELNSFREPEEFYDLVNDSCERTNLIAAPERQNEIETMRQELLALMRRTGDPFAEAFANRGDKGLVPAVLEKMRQEYGGNQRQ